MAIIIIIINKTIMEQRFDWDQKSINDFIDIIFLFFLYVILYLYNIKRVRIKLLMNQLEKKYCTICLSLHNCENLIEVHIYTV